MSKIADVLTALQGEYKWAERDCFVTAAAVLAVQGAAFDLIQIHKRSEKSALKYFCSDISRCKWPANVVAVPGMYQPGDILIIAATTLNIGGWEYQNPWGFQLGFVTDDYTVWSWTRTGLGQITGAMPDKLIVMRVV